MFNNKLTALFTLADDVLRRFLYWANYQNNLPAPSQHEALKA
jgi:hypothetical protein